jgi:predicted dinucleotide-binding enzyme
MVAKAKKSTDIGAGSKVVIASDRAQCKETISRLTTRIGCTEKDLFSGNLEVAKVADGQIELIRADKAGVRPPVAAKFFELYTGSNAGTPALPQGTHPA